MNELERLVDKLVCSVCRHRWKGPHRWWCRLTCWGGHG